MKNNNSKDKPESMTTPKAKEIVVPKKSKINKPEELENKKIILKKRD